MEGVHGARPVRVGNELVDVAAPRLLGVVAHRGLESCQDGGEKRGGRRRKTQVFQVIHVVPQAGDGQGDERIS